MAFTPFTAQQRGGFSPFRAGLIAVVLILVAVYFAYTKANPFSNPYELNALFNDVNNLRANSAVRIAGVNVGKVKKIEPREDGSGLIEVTMEIQDNGLPIKEDAELKVRSRLFLEGNYFVDIHPGTPSAEELDSGEMVPPNQTASPVQFGEFLTTLQRETRENLQTFLREYSKALRNGGAEGFNQSIRYWEDAYKSTALVADATQGTERHDLSRLLRGQGRTFGALSRDEEALKDLITNLNTTAAAFAREDDALKATIPQLRDVLRVGRPALASLNRGLPSLRAFARDALPGVRSSSPTLDAQLPFIKQARQLVSEAELRGLAADLRQTVPHLVRLNKGSTRTLEQTRALSSCQNEVLLKFAKEPIPEPFFQENTGQPFFKQSARTFVGLAGESRMADANSPYFRVQAGGGPTTIAAIPGARPNVGSPGVGTPAEPLFSQLDFPLEGVKPIAPTRDRRPVFRPGVPCETQEPPNMDAPGTDAEAESPNFRANGKAKPEDKKQMELELKKLADHLMRTSKGLPSVDPLRFDEKGERAEMRKLGLERAPNGKLREKKKGPGR